MQKRMRFVRSPIELNCQAEAVVACRVPELESLRRCEIVHLYSWNEMARQLNLQLSCGLPIDLYDFWEFGELQFCGSHGVIWVMADVSVVTVKKTFARLHDRGRSSVKSPDQASKKPRFLTKLCHFAPPPLKGVRRRGKKMAELRWLKKLGKTKLLRTSSGICWQLLSHLAAEQVVAYSSIKREPIDWYLTPKLRAEQIWCLLKATPEQEDDVLGVLQFHLEERT